MKVLYLDSWTKGIHNFLRIDKALKERGVETLLVHKGSWGYEKCPKKEEIINGLLTRDITYYNTSLIYKMLEREKPDVIVMLTTNYIADRAAILAARSLGIKTVYLMHGIRFIESGDIEKFLTTIEYKSKFEKFKRAYLYLKKPVPNYLYSRYKLKGFKGLIEIYPYKLLLNTFRNPQKWIHYPEPSDELHCDLALVWGKAYVKYCVDFFGYPEDRVKVVGHPPLDKAFRLKQVGLSNEEKEKILDVLGINRNDRFCTYLEESLVESKFKGWTNEYRIRHLKEISEVCKKAGYKLVIKLHPVTLGEDIENEFKQDKNTVVFKNIELEKLIYLSDFVIGHLSTTLDIAIVFNKPILYPYWGYSKNLPSSYLSKMLVIKAFSPNDMLKKIQNIDEEYTKVRYNINNYIVNYITYTDGKSVERIAREIFKLGNK